MIERSSFLMLGNIMFEVNDYQVQVHKLYDHYKDNDAGYVWRKVFIIDNFYKNPDEVRNYALSSEITDKEQYTGDLIGKRVWEDNLELRKNLKPIYEFLCKQPTWDNIEYDSDDFDSKWDNMKFMVNVSYGSDFAKRQDNFFGDVVTYHKDNTKYKWASLVYLNQEDEYDGGTKFYAFKEGWPGFKPSEKDAFTCEMKYNRMVLYEARHTHGAILNRDMFQTKPRLTQVVFM